MGEEVTAKKTPTVEWAFFCAGAARDHVGLLSVNRIMGSVPLMSQPMPIVLAFGVHGEANSVAKLTMKLTHPSGETIDRTSDIGILSDGFSSHFLQIPALNVSAHGAYVVSFHFDGAQLDYTTTLPVLPSQEKTPKSQKTH
jgi:hypothetical protein